MSVFYFVHVMPLLRVKQIISKLFQPSSTSDWNNFISARRNLLEIISEAYCSSWIFSNMFEDADIILKLFHGFKLFNI